MASLLTSLPQELLVNVALETALLDPLAPPHHLIPLLCTCRDIYRVLHNNTYLLARIFKAKFDTTAAKRRLGSMSYHNAAMATQLKRNYIMLKRIRARNLDNITRDLAWAYILLLENDGRNIVHLKEYANVGSLARQVIVGWVAPKFQAGEWPTMPNVLAYAMWVLWMTTDLDQLRAEHPQEREEIIRMVLPFVVAAFRYPATYLPDNFPQWPSPATYTPAPSLETPHGIYSDLLEFPTIEIRHFDQKLTVGPPLIVPAANLILFSRRELGGFRFPPHIPVDRTHALQLGQPTGPTQMDYAELNAFPHVKPFDVGSWDWRSSLSPEQLEQEESGWRGVNLQARSAQWDSEWERLLGCYDPLYSSPTLRPYIPGNFTGLWQGRMVVPVEFRYMSMMMNPEFPPSFSEMDPFLSVRPLLFRLREHRACLPNPHYPLGDIRTGWMKAPLTIEELPERVKIRDTDESKTYCYETWEKGKPSPHDELTCPYCGPASSDSEEDMSAEEDVPVEEDTELVEDTTASEDPEPPLSSAEQQIVNDAFEEAGIGFEKEPDEDMEEYYDTKCEGINDTIFTGFTESRHGDAWGHYRFFGRVRKFDGLIALVGRPQPMTGSNFVFPGQAQAHPNQVHPGAAGTWIFRGYLHGENNWTGRWRLYAHDTGVPPWEGAFTASKRPDGTSNANPLPTVPAPGGA